MSRIARKNLQSSYNHIIVQGINKEYIFGKEKYAFKYKMLIKKKLKDSNVIVLAYCIMSNHAHLLTYTEKTQNLSKFMQKLNTSFSRFYNKENSRVGYVFKDRYYSQTIMNEKYVYNCLKYIHYNPVKAKIVCDAGKYKFSSYNEYLKRREIINDKSIQLLFGSNEDYKEQFLCIHKIYKGEGIEDVDNRINLNTYLKEIECRYGKKINEITKNQELLKSIIKGARENTNATLLELSKIFKLSQSTIARYSKK